MAQDGGYEPGPLLGQSSFAVIRSEALTDADASKLVKQIQLHGGKAVIDNYPEERLDLDQITHIIAATSDFQDYHDAVEQFKSIVKPSWVEASLATNRLANPRRY
ncbi:regulator of Ty1 Transposition, partial [Neophaeococcomyces mojaviensis]